MECPNGRKPSTILHLPFEITLKKNIPPQGTTHKLLKGHSKWVFCLNYNTASNLLVSGGCDGDVRIWNAARGRLFLFFLFFLPYVLICPYARQMHENTPCPLRLCDRCPLQQGRDTYSLLCIRRTNVHIQVLFNENFLFMFYCYSRIWNTSDGQCLKTLAEGHNAIWYVNIHDIYILHYFIGYRNSSKKVNTFNFRQTQNIFSLPHTIVLSVFGITKPHDV